MTKLLRARPFIGAELVFLTLGLPVLFGSVIPLAFLLPVVWAVALYCYLVGRAGELHPGPVWGWGAFTARTLTPLAVRFVLASAAIALLVWLVRPDLFLNFVRGRPVFWAVVMVAYPVLSVVPQELIFRSFFFSRYGGIFARRWTMIAASGIAFALAHVIFQNWVAPLLCLAGGILFARTYDATRSLALVSLEHALYGCMIFTVGLGRYFYHGAVGTH